MADFIYLNSNKIQANEKKNQKNKFMEANVSV